MIRTPADKLLAQYGLEPARPDSSRSHTMSEHNATPILTETRDSSPLPLEEGGIALTVSDQPYQTPTFTTLNVRGKIFRVAREILDKLPTARTLLLPQDEEADLFYICIDPELFAVILDHLRTDTFPLFWSKTGGFDVVRYHRLQLEAEILQLQQLHEWIRDQKYLKAIQIVTKETIRGVASEHETVENSANFEILQHLRTRVKYVYDCPRNIPSHRVLKREELRCGKACQKALSNCNGQERYDEVPVTELVTLEKTYVLHPEVCRRAIEGEGGQDRNGAVEEL